MPYHCPIAWEPSACRPSMPGSPCPACATGGVLRVGTGGRALPESRLPGGSCWSASAKLFATSRAESLTLWSQGTEARRCYGGQKHVKNYEIMIYICLHEFFCMCIYTYIIIWESKFAGVFLHVDKRHGIFGMWSVRVPRSCNASTSRKTFGGVW